MLLSSKQHVSTVIILTFSTVCFTFDSVKVNSSTLKEISNIKLKLREKNCSFMYLRPILCTLYGAVDFLNVLKKGCWWGGGVLLVHSEIYYVPAGDGWEEVLIHDVLHYVPVPHPGHKHYVCLRRGSDPGRLRHRWALYLTSYLDSLYCQ
jgi:hypothetical protein